MHSLGAFAYHAYPRLGLQVTNFLLSHQPIDQPDRSTTDLTAGTLGTSVAARRSSAAFGHRGTASEEGTARMVKFKI